MCKITHKEDGYMTELSVQLTDKQVKLVDTLVATGCSITEGAGIAGFAKGESGRVAACKALRTPKVQAYMQTAIQQTLGLNATYAAHKLSELSTGARSEYVQLEASKDILDRSGFKAPDKHMHLHTGGIKINIQLD